MSWSPPSNKLSLNAKSAYPDEEDYGQYTLKSPVFNRHPMSTSLIQNSPSSFQFDQQSPTHRRQLSSLFTPSSHAQHVDSGTRLNVIQSASAAELLASGNTAYATLYEQKFELSAEINASRKYVANMERLLHSFNSMSINTTMASIPSDTHASKSGSLAIHRLPAPTYHITRPNQDDCRNIRFFLQKDWNEYKKSKEDLSSKKKEEKKTMKKKNKSKADSDNELSESDSDIEESSVHPHGYLQLSNGVYTCADVSRLTQIQKRSKSIWNHLFTIDLDPESWGVADIPLQQHFYAQISAEFEEFRQCDDGIWKARLYATQKYPDWCRNVRNKNTLMRDASITVLRSDSLKFKREGSPNLASVTKKKRKGASGKVIQSTPSSSKLKHSSSTIDVFTSVVAMVPPPVMLAAPASVTDADALCQGSVAASTPYSSEAGVPPSSMHNGSIIVSHSTAGVSTNNAIASTSRLPSLQPGVASTSIHNSEANALNSINDVAHLPSLNKDTPKSTTVDNIMNDVTPLPSLNKETPKSTTVDNMMNDVAPLSSLTDDTAKASSADGSASTSHSTTNVMGTAGVETGSAPARHRRTNPLASLDIPATVKTPTASEFKTVLPPPKASARKLSATPKPTKVPAKDKLFVFDKAKMTPRSLFGEHLLKTSAVTKGQVDEQWGNLTGKEQTAWKSALKERKGSG